ncbi:type II toxin-antitoxin system RelE/ParE family toxin [Candidatus Accumulibacter sp. ACC003]|uniref:type II toxin-antitoxin system RelE/ParE family toxin n=1 Tax=Candidatus Accumulibacter sp. ACC003 TaxID=2823334 RepID=UPI0025C38932|nr:type II toxin-antitoxin system RelE/ParE family toxin [Candidatus Accumulibacter sp. ACC003]
MKYAFHPEAETEFLHAIDYYEECEPGLGYDFAVEVYSAIERTIAYPMAWPSLAEDVRRSLVRRFPYGILYSQQDDVLFVVAIMHLRREPDYWQPRSK